jgi:hypothetical protein
MSEQISKELKEKAFQRMTSPWFFTFIPWWVVFNYDFLLRIFGKFDTVDKINQYYCEAEKIRYTLAGCISPNGTGWAYDFWHWVFYTPISVKILLPVLATVFSMTVIACGISYIQDKYNSIMEKDYFWKKREKQYRKLIDEGKAAINKLNAQLSKAEAVYSEEYMKRFNIHRDAFLKKEQEYKDKLVDYEQTLAKLMERNDILTKENAELKNKKTKKLNK